MRISGSSSEAYKLIWSDGFDGEELNENKWSHRSLGPRGNAIIVEDCAKLDGQGNLAITTRRSGNQIHTGMVGTEGKFETTFGYFEARLKFQTQPGHWGAFWLQSANMAKVGNPQENGVEIDIIELFSTQKDTMFMNIHWDGYGDEHKKIGSQHTDKSLQEGWHVVGLEWTPEEYKFYLNGKMVWHTSEAVSHAKQYIILSLEVREWAGDISKAKLPDSLLIDYVRVYQK